MANTTIPDWTMLMLMGAIIGLFQVIIFTMVRGWVKGINETIKELGKAVISREEETRKLEIKMLGLAKDMSDQISGTISRVGDKFEEKSNMLYEAQNRLRIKENDDIWASQRKMEDKIDKRLIACHDKNEERLEKVWVAIESCQKECCPRREQR